MTEPPDKQPTFEQALAQLEGIVHELEDGNIDLEASLAQYERGVKLLRQCYRILERTERKIEILKGVGAHGDAIVEPMDDENLSLDEKSQERSKRRSSSSQSKPKTRRSPASDELKADTDVDLPGELF